MDYRKDSNSYKLLIAGMIIGISGSWLFKSYILNSLSLFRSVSTLMAKGSITTKLVLVARTDLGMGKGKVAAQCAHAAVRCYKNALQKAPEILKIWEITGQPKIVVKPEQDGEECLLQLYEKARSLGLVTSIVRDAGKTQVDSGTITAVGIGPGQSDLVDQVTKHLKLL